VQRQLGHAQITTTERIYGHLEETVLRSPAAETEERIRQAAKHYAAMAA
jgi:integrase